MKADWFGRYRLEVTDELRAFVERAFVEPAEPHERDALRAEALYELEGAGFVLESNGIFSSESQGVVLLRSHIAQSAFESDQLIFEKIPGALVELQLEGNGTIVSRQPGKSAMTFRRVSPEP